MRRGIENGRPPRACLPACLAPALSAAPTPARAPCIRREYVPVREMHAPVLGQVFLARRASDGAAVVVKTVERGPTVSSHVRAELLVHARCEGHPHVLQLLDVFLTDTHLALVMQRVAGGSLADCVTARGALPEPVARRFFQQYVAALGFLHSLGAEFREPRLDCKLLAPGPDAGPGADAGAVVKVQDFAYSKTEQINSDPNAALGSLPYTAPEVLANRIDSRRAVDVWGAGVGLYRMALGTFPFERAEDGTRSRDLVQKARGPFGGVEGGEVGEGWGGVRKGGIQKGPMDEAWGRAWLPPSWGPNPRRPACLWLYTLAPDRAPRRADVEPDCLCGAGYPGRPVA